MGRGGAHVDLGPARARVAKGKNSKKARAAARRRAQLTRELAAAAAVAAKRTAALRVWAAEERRLSALRRSLPRTAPPSRRIQFASTLQVTEIPVSHSNLLPLATSSPARLRDGPPDATSFLLGASFVSFNDATFSDDDDEDDEYAPIPERLAAEGGDDISNNALPSRLLRPRRSRAAASSNAAGAPSPNLSDSTDEPSTPPSTRQGPQNAGKTSKCVNRTSDSNLNKPRKIVSGVYTPPPRPRRGVLKRVGTDLARKKASAIAPCNDAETDSAVATPEVTKSPPSSPNSRLRLTKKEKLVRRVRRLSSDVMVITSSPSKGGEKAKADEKVNGVLSAFGSSSNAETDVCHINGLGNTSGGMQAEEMKENAKKSKKDRKRKRSSQGTPEGNGVSKNALSSEKNESGSPKKSPKLVNKPDKENKNGMNQIAGPPKSDVDGVEELEDMFSDLNKNKAKQRKALAAAKTAYTAKQKAANGTAKGTQNKKQNGARYTDEGLRVYTYDEIAEDQPSGLVGPCPFECSCCF